MIKNDAMGRCEAASKAALAWSGKDGYKQAALIIDMLIEDINALLDELEQKEGRCQAMAAAYALAEDDFADMVADRDRWKERAEINE